MPWLSWANSAACWFPVAAAWGCGPSSAKTGGGPGGGGGGGGPGALWMVGDSNKEGGAIGPWKEGDWRSNQRLLPHWRTQGGFQDVMANLLHQRVVLYRRDLNDEPGSVHTSARTDAQRWQRCHFMYFWAQLRPGDLWHDTHTRVVNMRVEQCWPVTLKSLLHTAGLQPVCVVCVFMHGRQTVWLPLCFFYAFMGVYLCVLDIWDPQKLIDFFVLDLLKIQQRPWKIQNKWNTFLWTIDNYQLLPHQGRGVKAKREGTKT